MNPHPTSKADGVSAGSKAENQRQMVKSHPSPLSTSQDALIKTLRCCLQEWFKRYGRDLPWRHTRDPYAILVSEFMLQQTQVATVLEYYARWMLRFPTLETLAAAGEDEILHLWQGLGYYSRARNLHRLANEVVSSHNGHIPCDYESLIRLPGVGHYTANAVLSFAFNKPAPVIDANIARVITRLFNVQTSISTSQGKAELERLAWSLQPKTNAFEFNSALMELGALICRSGTPNCTSCPIRTFCQAESPESLPRKSARPKTTEIVEHRAFVTDGNHLWLQQGEGKRWRGLWILPKIENPSTIPDSEITYPITRFRVRMHIHQKSGKKIIETQSEDLRKYRPGGNANSKNQIAPKNSIVSNSNYHTLTPHPIAALPSLPIASPHRRAIEKMLSLQGSYGCSP